MKKLLLIDGNAIMHRAYHALPPSLTTPKGEPSNAVYGFFSMLLTVVSDLKPEYVIVCFDVSKPTYRQSLYAGYHQHRPQMEDGLSSQFQKVREGLAKMKIATFGIAGYEADDVIGTIAHRLSGFSSQLSDTSSSVVSQSVEQTEKQKTDKPVSENRKPKTDIGKTEIETIILTGDRDLLQLINPYVKVLMPVVGVKNTLLHDEKSVEEKYGVKPSQFVDYKALIGDASDGYPGVTGIGPKTAAKLIQEYGTFEALYEKIGELPEKYATKLATDAEQAALAKKLATILTDAPVTFDINDCQWDDLDTSGAWETFEEFGFNSLQKRFAGMFKEIERKKKGEQLGLL